LVQLAMVSTAERHGELVAYFAPERALLCKPQVMCIRWAATAGQTGLGTHELQMIAVAQSKRFA
jgi:hypothetical protein